MPKTTKCTPRSFCIEQQIGVIVEGMFYPMIVFNKIRFKTIIVELIHSKKFNSAEVLLKTAIEQFTGYPIARTYKMQGLTDSEFYMKWRSVIKKHRSFYENADKMNEAKAKWAVAVKEGRMKYRRDVDDENARYEMLSRSKGKKLAQL